MTRAFLNKRKYGEMLAEGSTGVRPKLEGTKLLYVP
jgi:hypothetical protein